MTARRTALLLTPALLALAGCVADQEITAASTCHTSSGQFVAAPGCTISYSSSRTVTTSTTTTTTTVETPPQAASDEPDER
jgi:hypothetical protein